jgi:hypothetical protein
MFYAHLICPAGSNSRIEGQLKKPWIEKTLAEVL